MQWANVKEENKDNLNAVRSSLILQKETGSSVEGERDGDMKNARHTKENFCYLQLVLVYVSSRRLNRSFKMQISRNKY
jgi:hypothetical protein